MARPVLVCTDPGIDDFIALTMLLTDPSFAVCGIVAMPGNVGSDKTVNNALLCTELLHRQDVPVLRGSEKPLARPATAAKHFHGKTGLGEHNEIYTSLQPSEENAVSFIARMAKRYRGELTVVSLAPLTDLARVLRRFPEVKPLLLEILIMGGALAGGNITKSAEFNIYSDPEAAAEVLSSGVPIRMIGLDVTNGCDLTRQIIPQPPQPPTALGRLVPQMLEDYIRVHETVFRRNAAVVYDAVTVLELTHPEWFTMKELAVGICLEDGEHLGQTAVVSGKTPNCSVAVNADYPAIRAELRQFLQRLVNM